MVECNFAIEEEYEEKYMFKKNKKYIQVNCLLKFSPAYNMGYNNSCNKENCIFQKILRRA